MLTEDRIGDIVVHYLTPGRASCLVVAGIEDRTSGAWSIEHFAAPVDADRWERAQLHDWVRQMMTKRLENQAHANP